MFIEELSEPKVFVIDDVKKDAEPIISGLENLSVKSQFINASPDELKTQIPRHPINSVELIFLDLHYNTNVGDNFSAELCAQIIQGIVPFNKQYYLVIWSRDTDRANEVLTVLGQINLLPAKTMIKPKTEYFIEKGFDVERLFDDINKELDQLISVEDIYGEVVDVDEDHLTIDCLLDKDSKTFQLRRFDIEPFKNFFELVPGNYVSIRIITKPGNKTFEFYQITDLPNEIIDIFNEDHQFGSIDGSFFNE